MSPFALLSLMAGGLTLGMDDPAAVDHSLTVAEYIERGVPSPDRPWTAHEYGEAFTALVKVKAEDKSALPRKASERSGALFRRLVNEENLDADQRRNLPIGLRLNNLLGIVAQSGQIFSLYVNPDTRGARQEYGPECTELGAYLLRVSGVVVTDIEKFTATLSAAEKADPARRAGFQQIKGSLGTMLAGVLVMLNEREQYEDKDLDALAARLPVLVAPLWPWLDETVRKELMRKIEERAKEHPSATVRASMEKLRDLVRGINGPPRDPLQ